MRRKGKASSKEMGVYQLKVTLRDTRPPIWRRFQIPGNASLSQLHGVLQVVMGWEDGHLHQFRVGSTYYGTPDPEYGLKVKNEEKVRLDEVLRRPKTGMVYEYDFGDSWEHDVVLEAVLPPLVGVRYPVVLAGRRRCPPEDVGGIAGFYRFLEAMGDPKHPAHRNFRDWWEGSFDPEVFDIEEVNQAFDGKPRRRRPDV